MQVDSLVVGGGPGGLMAAVYLGRFRRSVVVDSIARRQSGEFATDCGSQTLAAQTVVLSRGVVGFALTPEQEQELLLSIAEVDRGETVSAEEVLAKLARRHG